MSIKLDIDQLDDLIRECTHITNCNVLTLNQFNTFYGKLAQVGNAYEHIFPFQCAKVEQLWDLWRSQQISHKLAARQMIVALSDIRDQFNKIYKSPKIFISHSTSDIAVVNKFVVMLEQIGIKPHQLFCSSISGYGIPQGSGDLYTYIRNEMSNDNLFVVMMLSQNYYNSPVCLNEMGAAWVKQSAYQSILLPGFHYAEIRGAINPRDISFSLSDRNNRTHALNEFKDRIIDHLGINSIDHNLWERFRNNFLSEVDSIDFSTASNSPASQNTVNEDILGNISNLTSDEKIILYYALSQQKRSLKPSDISLWLKSGEVYDIDIENGLDLLSTQGIGTSDGNGLVLDIGFFRTFIGADEDIRKSLKDCVDTHRHFAKTDFIKKWDSGKIDDVVKLLIAYIVDQQDPSLGARWSEETQISMIREWEQKNTLDNILSKKYSSCLNYLIQNYFVYEIGTAVKSNTYQYRLCLSLETYLLSIPCVYSLELNEVKEKYKFVLPF